GGWHWDHEHHAGERHRADPRDRYSQGRGSVAAGHPDAISVRISGDESGGWPGWCDAGLECITVIGECTGPGDDCGWRHGSDGDWFLDYCGVDLWVLSRLASGRFAPHCSLTLRVIFFVMARQRILVVDDD